MNDYDDKSSKPNGKNVDLSKVQKHLDWLKEKLYLDWKSENSNSRTVKRGQVYDCELGIGVGCELQKTRPCLIIQNNIGNNFTLQCIRKQIQ